MGSQHPDIITMHPEVDPVTGTLVFGALPDATGTEVLPTTSASAAAARTADVTIRGGTLVDPTDAEPEAGIELTKNRFAGGFGDEFESIERAQDAGHEVRIVGGRIVAGDDADQGPAIDLTDKRFAALTELDRQEIKKLVVTGAAATYIETLQHTSHMPQYFPASLDGIYLHTKPTRLGDELHVVIERDPSTRLYHANLWMFMTRENGRLQRMNLDRWVGTPGLSAHKVHLHPGNGTHGGVLCLSPDNRGGMPSLSTCVVRCAQWATGMGEVVRGRPFPFRQ